MTAVLLILDTQTGKGRLINAAHEAPILIRLEKNKKCSAEPVSSAPSLRLGDGHNGKWTEQEFTLEKDQSLFLYTDGLFSTQTKGGKSPFSDRRLPKWLAEKYPQFQSALQLTQAVVAFFQEHFGHDIIPDDVTVVTIRRTT